MFQISEVQESPAFNGGRTFFWPYGVVATSGAPLRGTRSDADGNVPETSLVDVVPGTKVIVTAFDGQQSQSSVVSTI